MNKAQSEMGGAHKGANNPFFKSKYADLGAVVEAVKEPFSNNGLSYVSGEWLSNSFTVNLTKQDAQGAGSAITYCRRYGLQAVAGIPSEDDDGNNASKGNSAPKGFVVDDTAKSWIEAVRLDASVLEQITDINYRNFIQGSL